MMKPLARALAIAGALTAAGCVSLLPETTPAKPRYQIDALEPGADASTGEPVGWSLVVDDPRATRAFDTVTIAVSTAPGKIEYFAGAEWADRAPRLFQSALVQSFEDSERILAVGDRGSVPIGDFVLQTDIRHIYLDVRERSPTASVSVYARLSDGRGKIYAARPVTARAPAEGESADAVISAFNEAFDRVLAEIVAWTFEKGEEASDREGGGEAAS